MGFFGIKSDFFRPAAIKVEPMQIDPPTSDLSGFATQEYVQNKVSTETLARETADQNFDDAISVLQGWIKSYDVTTSGGKLSLDASGSYSVIENVIISSAEPAIIWMLGRCIFSNPAGIIYNVYDKNGAPLADGLVFRVTVIGTHV